MPSPGTVYAPRLGNVRSGGRSASFPPEPLAACGESTPGMDVRQGFDTRSVAERILLVAGSLLLILGPALQAITEIREYGELLDALDAADVPGVALEGLKLR